MESKYPMIAKVLDLKVRANSSTRVVSYTIDDTVKLLKQVVATQQKLEVAVAKKDLTSGDRTAIVRQLNENKELLTRISQQLSRVLGLPV